MHKRPRRRWARAAGVLAAMLVPGGLLGQTCERTITADVVALDQAIFYNRLGAHDPAGMMFALKRDVVPLSGSSLGAGNVRLRDGLRPRPLTLRANEGDCLKITFTNLLSSTPKSNQPGTRDASIHVMGMQLVGGIASDGSFVGQNASSLVAPGGTATYTLHAVKEGTFLLYSTAQTTGGDGDGGTISKGLFGAVNVEPKGAEWYRSQLTAEEMKLASAGTTAGGQPIVNYDALYPSGHPRAGLPILKMLHNGEVVHSSLTAIITGPNRGPFPAGTYPQVVVNRDRHQPFREVTVIFHDEPGLVQAFNDIFDDPRFEHTLHSGRDAFAINYGTGGIGAEVLGNRFGVGPMGECTECKYEEFFLSSWAVGDPAMLVDVPADFDGNGDGQPDA
ncbi:MAG TPA: multicopper oxidase domain-containing protein, partial [Longimicrobiaceae bacterium]|nr:multicopper oxidase domain-containing protein [Longimicrobiaceae bacterium]